MHPFDGNTTSSRTGNLAANWGHMMFYTFPKLPSLPVSAHEAELEASDLSRKSQPPINGKRRLRIVLSMQYAATKYSHCSAISSRPYFLSSARRVGEVRALPLSNCRNVVTSEVGFPTSREETSSPVNAFKPLPD